MSEHGTHKKWLIWFMIAVLAWLALVTIIAHRRINPPSNFTDVYKDVRGPHERKQDKHI